MTGNSRTAHRARKNFEKNVCFRPGRQFRRKTRRKASNFCTVRLIITVSTVKSANLPEKRGKIRKKGIFRSNWHFYAILVQFCAVYLVAFPSFVWQRRRLFTNRNKRERFRRCAVFYFLLSAPGFLRFSGKFPG